jgi:hypothetical protein
MMRDFQGVPDWSSSHQGHGAQSTVFLLAVSVAVNIRKVVLVKIYGEPAESGSGSGW